jgi:hypothetical protein
MGKWVGNGQVGWNRAPHSTAGRGMGQSQIGDCPKLRDRTTCAARHGRGSRAGGLFDYFEVLTQEYRRREKILKKRIKLRTGRVRKRIILFDGCRVECEIPRSRNRCSASHQTLQKYPRDIRRWRVLGDGKGTS